MRNFWIEADIDGRQTRLKGGPVGKDGEMTVTIYQRSDGCSVEAVKIYYKAKPDGNLVTCVYCNNREAFSFGTER